MQQQHAMTETANCRAQRRNIPPKQEPDEPVRTVQPAPAAEREQAIRETAYACYEARGCVDGDELDDWLKAEAGYPRLHALDGIVSYLTRPGDARRDRQECPH
ncbi:MAG: DUF2934 domain-containing protein [Polaromonas sp.]|uniref:DUF2934 domain-containing protein n=1 Tax=Thiobacillus denitrificans TaxID=36861 RepID=A0A106BUJ8_THIDE|nr:MULTISPECIES: DUF2934 domain-containing protein [Betaproteobacteria]KVW98890.1 hypothetical protein ABW22_02885 [Thiobacillus denitrificans]MDP2256047.1 DUF2934 domain-containing protein [Polaromonas sp.]